APPAGRRTWLVADTFSRTLYTLCAGVTFTASSCADQPTRSCVSPILNDGLPRSHSPVGATSPMRPRTRNADTNTFGAYDPFIETSRTGSARLTFFTN